MKLECLSHVYELSATKPFAYKGKPLKPGDRFLASSGEARTLIATGCACEYVPPEPEALPVYVRKRSPVAARPAGARTSPRPIH